MTKGKTKLQQPGENGPHAMPDSLKYPECFSCKKKILSGEHFYSLKANKFIRRHVNCPRNPEITKEEKTEDDIRRSNRRVVTHSAKRRRNGSHGYSGGDGFSAVR